MISISNSTKTKLLNKSINKEIILRFPDDDLEIRSPNIVLESFELESSICDESEFIFGGCISSQMKIKVINIETSLNEKRVNVYLKQTYDNGVLYPDSWQPSNEVFPAIKYGYLERKLFCGTVYSSLRQENRSVKEIIAYDDFYKLSKIKAYNYMSQMVTYGSNSYLYVIRDYCLNGIMDYNWGRDGEIIGVNDNERMSLTREYFTAVWNENLTMYDLLKAYCELNACFCIMNNLGKPKFIALDGSSTAESITYYSKLKFEEFETKTISGIQLYYAKDIKANVTMGQGQGGPESSESSWYIINNIILRSCSGYSVFTREKYQKKILWDEVLNYRPFEADVYDRWWLEPGDRIEIQTGYDDTETVSSFVFNRKIKGINGMHCTISAKGVEALGTKEMGE